MIRTVRIIKDSVKANMAYIILVTGEQGSGKTSLIMQTFTYYYKSLKKPLLRLYFEPNDWFSDETRDEREHAIAFDDAGLWLNRTTWYKAEEKSYGILTNVLRNMVYTSWYTSPSLDLPSYILNKANYGVEVKRGFSYTISYGRLIKYRYLQEKRTVVSFPIILFSWKRFFNTLQYRPYMFLREAKVLKYAYNALKSMKKSDAVTESSIQATIKNAQNLLKKEPQFVRMLDLLDMDQREKEEMLRRLHEALDGIS